MVLVCCRCHLLLNFFLFFFAFCIRKTEWRPKSASREMRWTHTMTLTQWIVFVSLFRRVNVIVVIPSAVALWFVSSYFMFHSRNMLKVERSRSRHAHTHTQKWKDRISNRKWIVLTLNVKWFIVKILVIFFVVSHRHSKTISIFFGASATIDSSICCRSPTQHTGLRCGHVFV